MNKTANATNGNSAWEDFKHWHKKFSDAKAAKWKRKKRESLETLRKELGIIKQQEV